MKTPSNYLATFCIFSLFFLTATFISFILTPLSIRIATIFGVIDTPDERRVHRQTMTRMGGLAIALSIIITTILCVKPSPFVQAYLLGMTTIAGIGLMDDKFHLPPRMKLMGEIVSSTLFVLMTGFHLTSMGNLLGTGEIILNGLSYPVTIFFMAGVVNSFNLADGLDGLAGGITLITCLFFLPLFYLSQLWTELGVCLILMGALLGFLRHNSYPAKLFMGDTGSLILGYSIACFSLALTHSVPLQAIVTPVAIFIPMSLPVVDMMVVMTTRFIQKKQIFAPDQIHLHHRLLQLGIPHRLVVAITYGLCFLLGLVGWWSKQFPEWQQFSILTIFFISIYAALWHWEKKRLLLSSQSHTLIRHTVSKTRHRISSLIGKTTRFVAPLFLAMLVAPSFGVRMVPSTISLLGGAASLMIGFLYPWRGGRHQKNYAHGLIFIAVFFLLLDYQFAQHQPQLITNFLLFFSIVAAGFVVIRVSMTKRYLVILPSSFEVLLLALCLFVPVVWCRLIDMDTATRNKIVITCFQAIPILTLTKLLLRRHARRNRVAMGVIMVTLLAISGGNFW